MSKETGQFNTNWQKAAYYMKCLETLNKASTGFNHKEIWVQIYDDMTWEEREEFIKAQKKREVKKTAKFSTKEIKKPKNVFNKFRDYFRQKCTIEGIEYTNDAFTAAYNSMSPEDKARYEAEYQQDMEAYKAAYSQLRSQAIDAGDYPEDKPKGALSTYMIFGIECRKPNNTYLTAEEKEQLTKISMKESAKVIANAYKRIKDEPAAMDAIKELAAADKVRYAREFNEWNIRKLERQLRKAETANTDTGAIATELAEFKRKLAISASAAKKSDAIASAASASAAPASTPKPATRTSKKAKPVESDAS
jgi:hypothetical protein